MAAGNRKYTVHKYYKYSLIIMSISVSLELSVNKGSQI